MPRKKSRPSSSPSIPAELLDILVKGPMSAEGVAELMVYDRVYHHIGTDPVRTDAWQADSFGKRA